MPRILLEDSPVELLVDRTAIQHFPVTESSSPQARIAEMPGRLSVAGIVNGNNRRYKRSVWENNLKEGAQLTESIKRNAAFGLLEHPKDGIVDLTSPIAILTTEAKLQGDEVHGRIRVLNTEDGRKLMALVEEGYNPLVSSRGFGSLTKAADGVDEVEDDYVCEGWDVVSKPSFVQAQLHPQREDKAPAPVPTKAAQESQPAPVNPPAKAPPAPPAPTTIQESKKTVMDANQIRENLSRVAAVDIAKLSPARFGESVARLGTLHQEVANYQAGDASRSWEAGQLHDEIKEIETRFQEAAQAPNKQVSKLQEDNNKLLRVTKAVGTAALGFKKTLAETVVKLEAKDKLIGEVARRGRSWKARYEAAMQQNEVLEEKYATASLAIDYMTEQYHTDLAETGRRILELEFPEQVKDAKIGEALKAANKPGKVIKVRESIKAVIKEAKEAKPKLGADGKPIVEAKEEGKDKPKPPVTEAKKGTETPAPTVQILVNERNPSGVTESIAMAMRLGKSNRLVEA